MASRSASRVSSHLLSLPGPGASSSIEPLTSTTSCKSAGRDSTSAFHPAHDEVSSAVTWSGVSGLVPPSRGSPLGPPPLPPEGTTIGVPVVGGGGGTLGRGSSFPPLDEHAKHDTTKQATNPYR